MCRIQYSSLFKHRGLSRYASQEMSSQILYLLRQNPGTLTGTDPRSKSPNPWVSRPWGSRGEGPDWGSSIRVCGFNMLWPRACSLVLRLISLCSLSPIFTSPALSSSCLPLFSLAFYAVTKMLYLHLFTPYLCLFSTHIWVTSHNICYMFYGY